MKVEVDHLYYDDGADLLMYAHKVDPDEDSVYFWTACIEVTEVGDVYSEVASKKLFESGLDDNFYLDVTNSKEQWETFRLSLSRVQEKLNELDEILKGRALALPVVNLSN